MIKRIERRYETATGGRRCKRLPPARYVDTWVYLQRAHQRSTFILAASDDIILLTRLSMEGDFRGTVLYRDVVAVRGPILCNLAYPNSVITRYLMTTAKSATHYERRSRPRRPLFRGKERAR